MAKYKKMRATATRAMTKEQFSWIPWKSLLCCLFMLCIWLVFFCLWHYKLWFFADSNNDQITPPSTNRKIIPSVTPAPNVNQAYRLPPAWNSTWENAGALMRFGIIGDSIGEGFSGASNYSVSWAGLVTTNLQQLYGDGGSGFVGVNFAKYDTNWDFHRGQGPGDILATSSTAGAKVNFAVRGSKIAVYSASMGGLCFVSMDGATQTPVSVNTGIAVTTMNVAPSTHSVDFIVGSGTCGVYGVAGEFDKGITVDNFSFGGRTSYSYITPDDQSYGNSWDWSGGPNRPVDILVYGIGVNDAHYSVETVAQYIANVDQIVNHTAATDVLFYMPAIGLWQQPAGPDYTEMLMALQTYAWQRDYGYLSIQPLAPPWSKSWFSDAIHPNDLGYSQMASLFMTLYSP
jgi:hypothetical protein